jgi:uncharacterized protein (DUF983 family)
VSEKRCARCGQTKPLTAFAKGQRWCKSCHRVYYVTRPRKKPLDKAFEIEF